MGAIRKLVLLAGGLFVLLRGIPAVATTQNATVNGMVFDEKTASPLPGATVVLSSKSTYFNREILSGADGSFRFYAVAPSDDYVLEVRKVGYEEYTRQPTVVRVGDWLILPPVLLKRVPAPAPSAPPPPPPAAETPSDTTLHVQTTPGGAQVYVDDESAGKTSPEGRLKISTLAPGEHRLRVSHDGYKDNQQTFDLAPGEIKQVAAILEALKPPPPPAQASRKPMSKDAVIMLLKGEVSPNHVADMARERGIDFELTPAVERELQKAGATHSLLATLREVAPKGAVPAEPNRPVVTSTRELRWHGVIVASDEEGSTITVRPRGAPVKMVIHYDASTVWTKGTARHVRSDFKVGSEVICLGTYNEKNEFVATRIDLREPR